MPPQTHRTPSPLLAALLLFVGPFVSFIPQAKAVPDPHLPPIDLRVTLALGISELTPIRSQYRRCEIASPSTNQSTPFSVDACSALSYVRKNVRPVPRNTPEEKSLFQSWSQVVYFGEVHLDEQSKDFVKTILPSLKAQGYDTLALEMFEAKDQKILDDFYENRSSLEQVGQALKASWNYDAKPYLRMIEAAHREGMRILALDNRIPGHQNFIADLIRRDRFMAEQVLLHLQKNPKSKVVAYTGGLHAVCRLTEDGSMPTQVEILNASGISANCFTLRAKKKSGLYSGAAHFLDLKGHHFLPLDRGESFLDGQFLLDEIPASSP